MSSLVRRHLEEAAGLLAIGLGILMLVLVTQAKTEPKREVFEFTNFSCRVNLLPSGKKDCVDQLNLFGSDGWQVGAATIDTTNATFWLQRKKQ